MSTKVAGVTQLKVSFEDVQQIGAEHTMPADAARALVRLEAFEIHFAQLDPYTPGRIVRLVVAKFPREQARELLAGYKDLLRRVGVPAGAGVGGGRIADALAQAKSTDHATMHIEADMLMASCVGQLVSLAALSMGFGERLSLAQRPPADVPMRALLEITLSLPAFVDLVGTLDEVVAGFAQ